MDSYKLTGKDLLYIIPLGDIHRGNPGCNYEYLDYWVKMVKKIKNPKMFILMGDLIEVGSKHVGSSIAKQNRSADTQVIETEDFLDPFIDDTKVMIAGNHKKRLEREFDLSLVRLMSHHLDIPYANQYRETFLINDKPFTIHASHGKTSNKHAHLAQGAMIRDTTHIHADLFLQGHNHRLDWFTNPLFDTNAYKGLGRRFYGFSGAFLNYDGYPDDMELPPLPPAFQFITLDKHLHLNNIDYLIDQRLPDAMEDFNELALRRG